MQTLKALIHKNLFAQAFRISTSLQNTRLTDTIYALFIKSNTLLDPFQSASLITHFSRSGTFSRAAYLLRHTHEPDIVVFNSLISGFARFNQPRPAFELYSRLRLLGLKPDVFTSSSLVKSCDSLNQTEIVHGGFIKLGFGSNLFLISGLIENYSGYGCLDLAEKCFQESLNSDYVVWSAMINGYVRNGEFEKGRECFMKMKDKDLVFSEFSLTSVLGAVFDVKEGEQIHGFSLKMGLLCGCSMHLNNALISMYGRCGCKVYAVKVFDEMPEPDVVSWTGLIGTAFDGVEAFEMFKCCISRGNEVNEFTLINVLSPIEGTEMLKLGKQIHTLVWKAGFLVVPSVCNALISMYAKSGKMSDARSVFDEMVHRDSVSWNSLISGYSENRLSTQAIEMFSEMRDSLLEPNEYTLASILEVASNSNSVEHTMQIHSLIIKLGLISSDSMICRLITAYGKCWEIDASERVLRDIDKVDVVHLNAMAGAYDHCKCYCDVQTLFHRRWNSSLEVDSVSFRIVLKACGALTDLNQGKSVHSLAIRTGITTDKFIESAVIDVYSKCGSIEDAEKAFWNTGSDNLAAWNAMIMGYAQFGCYSKAYDLFSKMPEVGMKPDEITYLGILSSCCHAGLISQARNHLSSMFDVHGVIPCLEHYACVVDVLGRAGLLDDAKETIDKMPTVPDARIWQILLSACTIYRNVDIGMVAARKLLELQPENESAFVLLSNLCASAGMWDAVRQLRREMKDKVVSKEPGSSWIQVKGSVNYFFADDISHPESREIYLALHALMRHMLLSKREEGDILYEIHLQEPKEASCFGGSPARIVM